MRKKIKGWVIKLITKKVINEITGREEFKASKTKIGVVLAAAAFLVDVVLPEFGVYLPISDKITTVAELLGLSLAGYGLRDAQEKSAVAAAQKK